MAHEPSREPSESPSSREEIMRRAGPYLGIGSTFLAAIGGCTIGGWWLDRWLDSQPWLTVAGAIIGVALGFYMFIKIVLEAQKRDSGGK
jgi:F0F1-type ATP synthase assembly protein I